LGERHYENKDIGTATQGSNYISGAGRGVNSIKKKRTGWKQKILHEMIDYWLTVLYMALFFGVFFNYRRLILAHHQISYEDYGISVIWALVLAKVVLVAESFLRLGRRFEEKPLIVPTLYKSFIFTVCVALFHVVESMIRSFIHGMGLMGAVDELMSRYNYEWLAGALVVFISFIPFFAVRELRQVLGEGTIGKLFFKTRLALAPGPAQAQDTSEK
jgi:hypothetical protein